MKIATLSRHWSIGVELTKWYSARLTKDRRDKQDKTDGQTADRLDSTPPCCVTEATLVPGLA